MESPQLCQDHEGSSLEVLVVLSIIMIDHHQSSEPYKHMTIGP